MTTFAPTAPRTPSADPPLRLPHTDWLYHHLDIEGGEETVGEFASWAAGAGTIPWCLDLDQLEEDAFHTLAAAGELSLSGARILAGQLRTAAGLRHRLAVDRVGLDRSCPFDLHALLPVPDTILCLGPTHPEALSWLWTAWGTTDALRHVTRRATSTGTRFSLTFWSADWTPWRAVTTLAAAWPTLRFAVRPLYGRN